MKARKLPVVLLAMLLMASLAVTVFAAYPTSGFKPGADSAIINGTLIGAEGGWGDNAAAGRAAAFDGDLKSFFDPTTASVDYCGMDAGEKYILTGLMIHPRDGQLPRFLGATIEAANKEDFSDKVVLFESKEEGKEFTWKDCTSQIDTAKAAAGYRYFRYINYTSHGDVAEVEFYGKPLVPKAVETTAAAAATTAAAESTAAPATFDMAAAAVAAAALSGAIIIRKRRG